VFLDIASRLPADEIRRRLPSMYHQFKELADVDITAGPMEVGPTCHYVMGGVEVDPDTAAATVPGLFAVGEVSGGMHGSNRLGGNSLSDLLVFGRRAGAGASEYVDALGTARPVITDHDLEIAQKEAEAPFTGTGGENPYAIHADLQQTMNDLVGIIRTEAEVEQALAKLEELKARAKRITVQGDKLFNPGWHLALDLPNMLTVSECVARAALMRQESRGGHTRDDYPEMSPEWRKINLVCRPSGDGVEVTQQPLPVMPPELLSLFDRDELTKYMTDDELAILPEEKKA
jgi:succinate dehydrogenase / fumarate reductase, flavoprotein subunit